MVRFYFLIVLIGASFNLSAQEESIFAQCNEKYVSTESNAIEELNYYFPPNTGGITRTFYAASRGDLINLSFYFNNILKGQINFIDLVESTALHNCSSDASGLSPEECVQGPVKIIFNGNTPAQIIQKDMLQNMGELDAESNFIGAPENILSRGGLKVEINLPENICHLKIEMNRIGLVTVVSNDTPALTRAVDKILVCPDNDACTGDAGSLSIVSEDCKPHLKACFGDPIWETPNGGVNQGDLLEIALPGMYNVTGQYSNACSVSATIELAEDFFTMPDLLIEKNGPGSNACNLQDNQLTLKSNSSSISIDDLETTWSKPDGSLSQGNPINSSLPGEHTAKIIYNGFCLEQNTNVDCNPNIEIVSTEKPSSLCEGGKELSVCPEAQNIRWKKPNQLGAIQTETLIANVPGSYTVTAIDSLGCSIEGSYQEEGVLLQEIENNALYVPNAFSPNRDGVNDVFSVYSVAGSGVVILDFKIFSRWGELVHEKKNFQVNDLSFSWDGRVEGKAAHQGVYTYQIIYKLPECEEKMLEGGFTLLR